MLSQVLASGLTAGSVYALMALALVVTYKTTRVANFAQGEMAMLSAFVAYAFVTEVGLGFAPAFFGALVFAFLLGCALEVVLLRRVPEPDHLKLLLATLGFMLAVFGFAGWKWGGEQRSFPFPVDPDATIHVLGVAFSALGLVTVATAAAAMLGLFGFFRFTRAGLAMRAVQQDARTAMASGVPSGRFAALAFGISSVLGAVAALLTAPGTSLDPTLMWDPLLKGFAAAVLGGLGTPIGAVMGGYLLGMIESAFGAYVSIEFKSTLAFLIIVGVLWLRPSGLFGAASSRGTA